MKYEFRCPRSAGKGRNCGKQIAIFEWPNFYSGDGGTVTAVNAPSSDLYFLVCSKHGNIEWIELGLLRKVLERQVWSGQLVSGWKLVED